MAKTMIERVAKALAAADNGAPTTWKLYVDDARVAIEAMRIKDPLSPILAAGQCTTGHWNRMIDEALA